MAEGSEIRAARDAEVMRQMWREADAIDIYRLGLGGPPPPGIAEVFGLRMVEVDVGRIVFAAVPERRFYNPMGTIHGGYFGTLLDTALGCAVHTALKKGLSYTTLEYKVSLIRAMTEKTGPIRCEGRVINAGSRVATSEASIVDAEGRLYAHGTSTCLVFPI